MPFTSTMCFFFQSKKMKSDTQKKTARRATSNVFAMFEQNQIAEFKEVSLALKEECYLFISSLKTVAIK